MFHRFSASLIWLFVWIFPLAAQQPTTLLTGSAVSQSGQAVANARIVATPGPGEVGAPAEATSDPAGRFTFRSLAAGVYDLRVEAAGYYAGTQRGVPVALNEPFEVEIRLAEMDRTPEVRSGESNVAAVQIFYATDRKRSGDARAAAFFGGQRDLGSPLQYGTAEVTVPYQHVKGQLETPVSILGVSFQPDPRKHFVLVSLAPSREDAFFRAMSNQLQRPGANSLLVFIHGYANTFEDGALRLAQLSLDLDFKGVPVLFSWPSVGTVAAYKQDEGNVEWATFHFQAFLEKLTTAYPGRPIYIVAHSMGSRAMSYAVRNIALANGRGQALINQIVLAAPDIDAAVFQQLATTFRKVASRVTLYVSADDFPLKQSRRLSGYPRAGQGGDGLLVMDGVDTVECTGLDPSFLAHSYYAENVSVVSDVSRAIRGMAVSDRKSLTPVPTAGGTPFYKMTR